MRSILKSGHDHCCENLEILCPLKKEDLENIVKFLYEGNIISSEKSTCKSTSENLIQVFGFPGNISFDCEEKHFDPLDIVSESSELNANENITKTPEGN